MPTPDEIVAQELARLSAEFVEQLPAQMQAVADDTLGWLSAPLDAARYEALSHRVHQLKGSASTFGCPGISREALVFERRIGDYRRELEAGRLPPREDVEAAMTRLLDAAGLAQKQSGDTEAGP